MQSAAAKPRGELRRDFAGVDWWRRNGSEGDVTCRKVLVLAMELLGSRNVSPGSGEDHGK
jgi:hypothetical protein